MSKSSNKRKVKQLQIWLTQELRFGKGKWKKIKWIKNSASRDNRPTLSTKNKNYGNI